MRGPSIAAGNDRYSRRSAVHVTTCGRSRTPEPPESIRSAVAAWPSRRFEARDTSRDELRQPFARQSIPARQLRAARSIPTLHNEESASRMRFTGGATPTNRNGALDSISRLSCSALRLPPLVRPPQRRATLLVSPDRPFSHALAFKRSGDPGMGSFTDAVVLKTFGEVPDRLDEL
jgi:hypothetical protein